MNRRSLLRGFCGVGAFTAVASVKAVEPSIEKVSANIVLFEEPEPQRRCVGIDVEVKDSNSRVLCVYGQPEHLEVFHDAWQTHVWPGWKTHKHDAGRRQYQHMKEHWEKSGSAAYWINLRIFMDAALVAIDAIADAGITSCYHSGFGNESYPVVNLEPEEANQIEMVRNRLKSFIDKKNTIKKI